MYVSTINGQNALCESTVEEVITQHLLYWHEDEGSYPIINIHDECDIPMATIMPRDNETAIVVERNRIRIYSIPLATYLTEQPKLLTTY